MRASARALRRTRTAPPACTPAKHFEPAEPAAAAAAATAGPQQWGATRQSCGRCVTQRPACDQERRFPAKPSGWERGQRGTHAGVGSDPRPLVWQGVWVVRVGGKVLQVRSEQTLDHTCTWCSGTGMSGTYCVCVFMCVYVCVCVCARSDGSQPACRVLEFSGAWCCIPLPTPFTACVLPACVGGLWTESPPRVAQVWCSPVHACLDFCNHCASVVQPHQYLCRKCPFPCFRCVRPPLAHMPADHMPP